jgi:GT2 family glycosyltransferase
VDDCSDTANSEKNRDLCLDGSRAVYIRNNENLGLAGARMVGVNASQGQFLLFLDDDIIAGPRYVMSHLQVLQSSTKVCTVGALSYREDFVKKSNSTRFLHNNELGQSFVASKNLGARHFGGGICGVSRADLLKVGGFDLNFNKYGSEDVDLGLKLAQIGTVLRFVCGAKAIHDDLVTPWRLKVKAIENAQFGAPLLFDKYQNRKFLGVFRSWAYKASQTRVSSSLYVLALIIELILFRFCVLFDRWPIFYLKVLYITLMGLWSFIGFYRSMNEVTLSRSLIKYTDPLD